MLYPKKEEKQLTRTGILVSPRIEYGGQCQETYFYFEHHKEINREITLFCALRVAEWIEEDELWIKIYEYGLVKKIKPREDLKAQYRERTGKFRNFVLTFVPESGTVGRQNSREGVASV